jgi:hypothetical protein
MTKAVASRIVGGLSNPSKMPGFAFGLPARKTCPIGDKLAVVEGTPCSTCYATRNLYALPATQTAQARRLTAVEHALAKSDARAEWIDAMVTLLRGQAWFRWHDSGDIFSADYLSLIIDVVRLTPTTRHWLPTQERSTVRAWMREHGALPENLTIRVSMPKIDASAENIAATQRVLGLPTSSVSTTAPTCPARLQKNSCRDCRACWDRTVPNVAYAKH